MISVELARRCAATEHEQISSRRPARRNWHLQPPRVPGNRTFHNNPGRWAVNRTRAGRRDRPRRRGGRGDARTPTASCPGDRRLAPALHRRVGAWRRRTLGVDRPRRRSGGSTSTGQSTTSTSVVRSTGRLSCAVHGLAGMAVNWSAIAPLLTARYRVLAPDRAGHGLNPPGGRGTSVAANRAMLHRFMSRGGTARHPGDPHRQLDRRNDRAAGDERSSQRRRRRC